MKIAPALRQPEFHHLKDFAAPIAPASASGRVILTESGRGDCPVPPAGVSLKYVLDGEEHYQTPQGSAVVKAGQFAVVGPDMPLTAIMPRTDRTVALCLYLPETGPRPVPFEGEGEGEFGVFGGGRFGLGSLLEQTASRLVRRPQLGPAAASALLNRMRLELISLAHASGPSPDSVPAMKTTTRQELARRIRKARDYLHLHAARPVSLVELGRACGISPFHLARIFRQAYGVAPGAYHLELRLALAARLLGEGQSSANVAERLGYSEPSSFLRAFKQRYGTTPGCYADNRRVN